MIEAGMMDVEAARRSLGIATQAEMARLLGLKLRQYARLAAGESPPSPTATRLVEAYLAGYRPPDWPDRSQPE